MKNQRGITLISLVITIVVLIILAGVAINLTLGENGIFTKAQEAKRMQAIATANEKIGLEILTAQMEALERDESLEQEQLEDIISKYGALQADGDTIILNDNGYETSLLDIYKGTTTTSGSYTENKAKLELLEGQVELLQQQKGENEARIALLESEVELLEKQKADLQQQLEDLASSGGDQAQKIVELTAQIQTLEQEKNTLEQNLIVANAKVEEYEALKELLKETTVTANKILEDYKAYIDGEIVKGTMPNNGGVTKTINAGESYTIPQGYHNGTGVITASTLESQTSGTATEDKILKGYTAYKDGKLIKGTMENYAGKTVSASTITESGENALITIPENGYYSTRSKISVPINEINSNLVNFVYGTVNVESDGVLVELGFKPTTILMFCFNSSGPTLKMAYFSENTELNGAKSFTSHHGYLYDTNETDFLIPTDTGFEFNLSKTDGSTFWNGICYYYAYQ